MKNNIRILVTVAALCLSASAFSSDKAHWSYSGEEGPQHWGSLDSQFSTCATGKNQSPINLTRMMKSALPRFKINYQSGGKEIVNNGHSIQVNYAPGSSIVIDKQTFELKQFHFHSPSENTIDGRSFPMEAHFVHVDKQGNIAVIAVMFKDGRFNKELEKAWSQMPAEHGETADLATTINATYLLPRWHGYYRFNGSLTTPPCTEGVRWMVMKEIVSASREQIERFMKVMQHPNNRPVQPINARLITQ